MKVSTKNKLLQKEGLSNYQDIYLFLVYKKHMIQVTNQKKNYHKFAHLDYRLR